MKSKQNAGRLIRYVEDIKSYIKGDLSKVYTLKKLMDKEYHAINHYMISQDIKVVITKDEVIRILNLFLAGKITNQSLSDWGYFLLHKSFSPMYEWCDIDYEEDYEDEIASVVAVLGYRTNVDYKLDRFLTEDAKKMIGLLSHDKPKIKKSLSIVKVKKYSLNRLKGRLASQKRYHIFLQEKKDSRTYNIDIDIWRIDVLDKKRCPKEQYGLIIEKYDSRYMSSDTYMLIEKSLEFDHIEEVLDYLKNNSYVKEEDLIKDENKQLPRM